MDLPSFSSSHHQYWPPYIFTTRSAKVVYHVPSFGLFALSVIWIIYGYGLVKYIDYEQTLSDLSGARHHRDVDRYAIIIIGTQIVLFFVSGITVNCLAPF